MPLKQRADSLWASASGCCVRRERGGEGLGLGLAERSGVSDFFISISLFFHDTKGEVGIIHLQKQKLSPHKKWLIVCTRNFHELWQIRFEGKWPLVAVWMRLSESTSTNGTAVVVFSHSRNWIKKHGFQHKQHICVSLTTNSKWNTDMLSSLLHQPPNFSFLAF